MNSWKRLVGHMRPPQRSARPQVPLQVFNTTRNTILATQLTLADSPKTRERGLLGRDTLSRGEGLWIVPCQAIHMFFMRFSIDLVYIDRQKRVRKVRSNVAPWRISVCLSAHSVLELPAGTVRETSTQRGDVLEISPIALMPPTPETGAETNLQHPGHRLSENGQDSSGLRHPYKVLHMHYRIHRSHPLEDLP